MSSRCAAWCVVLGQLLLSASYSRGEADPATAIPLEITLSDSGGIEHALKPDPQVRVWAFVFLSTECPLARRFIPTLNQIATTFSSDDKPLRFFGVISDKTVTRAVAAKFAEEDKLKFPVLLDASNELAAALAPTHVPRRIAKS